MTLHLHELRGCAPAPLAFYLKALGILRVAGAQADASARGAWDSESFSLTSALSREELEGFFLERYSPTPWISPWNKGSGFYADADPVLGAIERSVAPRFGSFREGIRAGRAPLDRIARADAAVRALKDRTKVKKGASPEEQRRARALGSNAEHKAELAAAEREFKQMKSDLLAPLAKTWRGGHRDWLDAAVVIDADGETDWPALLGTGGNDGRLDFTYNAMQRLGELFDLASSSGSPRPNASSLLRSSLWGCAASGLSAAAVGQFLPGNAGGANGSTGPDAAARINPWDFLLMLEGALFFRGATTRRLDRRAGSKATIPFAVSADGAGVATRGREKTERGEQWMPIWDRWASAEEVHALFAEGRAQLSRQTAHRPLEFARAIARLGVARGLRSFTRYGYLERNGQSKIAVPIGTIQIGERPYAELLDDLAPWLDRVQRLSRDDKSPARLQLAEAELSDAAFAVVTRDATPAHWQDLLLRAVAIEMLQVSGTGFDAGPIPPLGATWLEAADDGSPEWRLAVALGSASAERRGQHIVDPVRAHALPLDKRGNRYLVREKRLARDPRVVCFGRDAVADLIAIVERRILEAERSSRRVLPLVAAPGRGARIEDLAALIDGRVDLERTLRLARALMALRWRTVPARRSAMPISTGPSQRPDEAWVALRLCGLPFPVAERRIPIDAAMVRRAATGDAAGAVAIALRRLSAAGLRPPLRAASAAPQTARLWAAALAFPIEPKAAHAMARAFSPTA